MKNLLFSLAAAALIAVGGPAVAQQCFVDREAMLLALTEGTVTDEIRVFRGVSDKYAARGVIGSELWLDLEKETFTYVFEYSNGQFCIGDHGTSFILGPYEPEPEEEEPEGDPT